MPSSGAAFLVDDMKKLLAAIILLGLSTSVFGQQDYPRDITLSWTNASQYEDGSLIEAGDLTSVRVECFRNSDTAPSFTAAVPVTGEGIAQTFDFIGVIPNPGQYSCIAYSIIFDGTESIASNAVLRKYTGKPKPPVLD